ncbi:unnamed protein product, partial [Rotaria sp. Silwood1]
AKHHLKHQCTIKIKNKYKIKKLDEPDDEDEQRQRYIPTPSQFCQDDGSYLISCSCSSSLVDVKSLDNELGRIS